MKRKNITVVIASILSLFILTGCGSASNSSTENVDINESQKQEPITETPPMAIDDVALDITIREHDGIGQRYMDGVLTNNSDKLIKSCTVKILLKDKNEETYLMFLDTIMPKEKSVKSETFAPDTGNKEDIEILNYEFVLYNEGGEDIYLEYDPKLKEYNWF